jgi:hypothetical protein
MGHLFGTLLLAGFVQLTIATSPTLASSCTERQQVCYAYCEKTYNNAPACREKCVELHHECLASGCWESKVAAKRCGFSKK